VRVPLSRDKRGENTENRGGKGERFFLDHGRGRKKGKGPLDVPAGKAARTISYNMVGGGKKLSKEKGKEANDANRTKTKKEGRAIVTFLLQN